MQNNTTTNNTVPLKTLIASGVKGAIGAMKSGASDVREKRSTFSRDQPMVGSSSTYCSQCAANNNSYSNNLTTSDSCSYCNCYATAGPLQSTACYSGNTVLPNVEVRREVIPVIKTEYHTYEHPVEVKEYTRDVYLPEQRIVEDREFVNVAPIVTERVDLGYVPIGSPNREMHHHPIVHKDPKMKAHKHKVPKPALVQPKNIEVDLEFDVDKHGKVTNKQVHTDVHKQAKLVPANIAMNNPKAVDVDVKVDDIRGKGKHKHNNRTEVNEHINTSNLKSMNAPVDVDVSVEKRGKGKHNTSAHA